jgi:hypothetical protein
MTDNNNITMPTPKHVLVQRYLLRSSEPSMGGLNGSKARSIRP